MELTETQLTIFCQNFPKFCKFPGIFKISCFWNSPKFIQIKTQSHFVSQKQSFKGSFSTFFHDPRYDCWRLSRTNFHHRPRLKVNKKKVIASSHCRSCDLWVPHIFFVLLFSSEWQEPFSRWNELKKRWIALLFLECSSGCKCHSQLRCCFMVLLQ